MAAPNWSVQDAKNRFSAVIKAAQREPQTVTKHGKPAAIVLSAEEYARLTGAQKAPAKSFVEHLLSIPKGGDDECFERQPLTMRDVDL